MPNFIFKEMTPTPESYFSVFMLFGASLAATSIFLLLKSRNRPYANNILALLCLSWGFSCYWFFAFIQGEPFFSRTLTTFIGPMIPLTLFPPIYLYVKYLYHDYKSFNKRDHLHFIPVYLYGAFTLYLFISNGYSIEDMRSNPWYPQRSMISSYIAMLQGPVYFLIAHSMLGSWQQKLKQEYSDIENKKLKWLRNINLWFAPIFVIGGLSTILKVSHLNPFILYMVYHGVMCLSLVYIHITIFKNSFLFSNSPQPVHYKYIPLEVQSSPSKPKHNKKNTFAHKDENLIERLGEVMSKEKLYKNPNINLNDLSLAIGHTRNSLSYELNNTLKKSFYDYINHLRIEESKRLLLDKSFNFYTIEAISSEAGFKSVSVFYRLFKESEKITPAEFRKQNPDVIAS